MVTKFPNKTS